MKGNWFQRAYRAITKGAAYVPFMSSFAARLGNYGALVRRDYLKEYKNWVFACVQARAEEVSNLKLVLKKDGEVVDAHEVLDLLDKVNPRMTRHELFYATQAFLDLDGNAFWYLARDNNGQGKIQEIYILRPDRISIVGSKGNPLDVEGYVFTQPDGQRVPFGPNQILHFKNFNPLGGHPFPHRGMGIVEAASWAIETDNESRAYNLTFFKNSARPDGILTTAGDAAMDSDEFKRLREEWNSEHQGSDNASKVAVLGGGVTWTEIERSQKDMDFYNGRTFSRDEILALFRVPKSILGIVEDVNRANAEATIYIFALRTIAPLMQHIVDYLNEFLLSELDENLKFEFESPVVEDRKKDLDEYAAALPAGTSWMTINEVREREGLPRVAGGDGLYVPLTSTEVAVVVPEPVKVALVASRKEVSPAKGVAESAVEKLLTSRTAKTELPVTKEREQLTKKAVKALTAEQKGNYIELYKRTLANNRGPLVSALHGYFSVQEKEVMERAKRVMKFRPAKLSVKGVDDFLFNEDEAISAGINLITPFISEYIKNSGGVAAALVGLANFNPNTDSLNKFTKDRAKYFAESINGTTSEALLASIKEGLDAGEDLGQIESRIATVYGEAKGARTQMIARTEVSAASNEGVKGAYQQAGVDEWQWVVVSPEDEDCRENDGAVVKIGDPFPDGDTQPPVHPNCECTTIPVFD